MDILPQIHAPPQEKGANKMDIYAEITNRIEFSSGDPRDDPANVSSLAEIHFIFVNIHRSFPFYWRLVWLARPPFVFKVLVASLNLVTSLYQECCPIIRSYAQQVRYHSRYSL